MSAESPRHIRSGGPLTVPSQPPADRSLIDAVSGFINDVKLTSAAVDPKDVIQWARFETADINEPTPEGDSDNDSPPLLLVLGYGTGVQVWLIPPSGEAQEVLSWRQGTVRVLRILPTPAAGDCFTAKRPLIALCDSASPGLAFCSLSFISIRGGEQVKSIKFKNPILDVLANKRSVVVSFSERFAVFDAGTLEDRMAVTTCYPCPCPLGGSAPINPLALGDRWLAYADKKLNPSKRSSGGCESEGQTSYTATVLHAAKSLSKGLRGLGETVAHSLAGTRAASQSPSPPHADQHQPGVVTVLDIEGIEDDDGQDAEEQCDPIVAHFVAHSEAIIALKFDCSGMVLVTADRRGHDFHVFRINPHPCGPALAAVHHLYVLHRGDTTAKVQDIAISGDCRWAAVSTLRGTTHVFALSPYGGGVCVRTHTTPRVVNRLSRFHRSAGLPIHAPAGKRAPPVAPASPVGESLGAGAWFPNPRLPPYPLPTQCAPLAQLRPNANLATHTITRTSSGRQRLSSLSEDNNSAPLLARAAWGAGGVVGGARGTGGAQHALYLMAASGALLHLVLHPRPAAGVPKEKISDDSPIELEVEPAAQWPLQRAPAAADLLAPLPPNNPLLQPLDCRRCTDMCMSEEERWLAQVEIVTHAGPHRRLWMGPQFVFKTYNTTGSNSSLSEAETVDVEASAARGVARSNPVNMPGVRPIVPVLIDSGSASSLEQSPSDSFRRKSLLAETGRAASVCDVQLKEDLAEAMKEDHGSRRGAAGGAAARSHGVEVCVDPLGTAVRAGGARAAPPPDGDEYTRDNADEATFRPVVRAPAALPRDIPARPLPRTTTIPVQPLAPRPLPTDVVIPAALSAFLAADARLEREMDDATREPPPRHPTSGSPRLGDVSSSVKVAVELDPSRGTPTRAVEKLEGEPVPAEEPPSEIRMSSPRRRTPEPEEASRKAAELELIPETRLSEVEASPEPECDEVRAVEERKPDSKPARSARATSESKTSRRELSDQKKEGSQVKTSSRRESSETKSRLSEAKKSSKEVISSAKVTSKAVVSNTNISSVSDTKISSKEVIFGTKISSKEVIPDTKILSNEVVLDTKTSSKEVVPDTKISSKEIMSDRKSSKVVGSDTKISAKEVLPDTKVSSKEMLSNKKSTKDSDTKISPKEIMPDKKLTKEEHSDAKVISKNTTSDVTISETKISKEVIPEMKTLAKRERPEKEKAIKVEISETKSSTKKELTNRKVSSEEAEPETKTLPKNQLSDTRPCVKKDLPDANITATKEVDEMKLSKELPKLKTSVKRDSSFDRESSPRKEQKGFKSAWKKDSNKLEWPAKVEPVETMVPPLKELDVSKTLREQKVVDIRTEEQAWDMLLNEPEKQVLSVSLPPTVADEAKIKSKKNRKIKKTQDDTQNKSEDDSFVEIHAIEENGQPSSGELVSISMPFEEIESSSSYSSKTKKSRSPKNTTDKKEQFNAKLDDWSLEDIDCTIKIKSATRKNSASSELELVTECDTKTKLRESKTEKVDSQKEESVFVERPLLKDAWKKPKSGITCQENRTSVEKCLEVDVKDVYVIDSTKEEFPEIQITTSRGSKMRKKSPQVDKDKKSEEIEMIPEMPVKSWSSIAASKSLKKPEEDIAKKPENKIIEKKIEDTESDVKDINIREKKQRASKIQDEEEPISLHEELMRLCKRTDIMVAQCDAPSGLNFVEEHHSLLDDLPPLELDFGLDDFRLEVMRDGLLDVDESTISSPICKINIDSILSSIKESSSAFNLIDLEKVPDKKEKGFSVVEYDKITTQEVKADDDSKSDDKEIEVMEKSSDDDNTSPASADSDKEDKKSTGASNVTLPSSKQSSKSKKSRRKKK